MKLKKCRKTGKFKLWIQEDKTNFDFNLTLLEAIKNFDEEEILYTVFEI